MLRPKPLSVADFRRLNSQPRTGTPYNPSAEIAPPRPAPAANHAGQAAPAPRRATALKPAKTPASRPAPAGGAAYIGIDPGISTGVALLVLGQPMEVHTLDFWEAIAFLARVQDAHPALLVVIEDPNLDGSLYARYDGVHGAARTKIAQNVGANKRDAQLLLAWCARAGLATRAVRPPGKLTAAAFAARTGISRCSQHARDAAHLLFGYLPHSLPR